jgi:lipid-binding SYLF domain-containing protein
MITFTRLFMKKMILAFLFIVMATPLAFAGKADSIRMDARAALDELLTSNPGARALSQKASAVLVFPDIVKGGFIIGGQYGDGALFRGDTIQAYYRSFAASYGLQAGIQRFGYVLFFMTESDLDYINHSDGWEVGVGPSLVIVDEDMARAKTFTTTTTKDGIYAFIFSQKGLMAGLGIQGTKITRIYPR